MKPFDYVSATDVGQASKLLGEMPKGRAKIIAGGIDLLDEMKEGIRAPERLINIKSITGLKEISEEKNPPSLRVGPLVTLAELSENELIRKYAKALALACEGAATPQIRNVATLGGNLCQRPRCWYYRGATFNCLKKGGAQCFAVEGENQYHAIFGEGPCHIVHPSATATALLALGGQVVVQGNPAQYSLHLDKFFTMPHENLYSENILKDEDVIYMISVPKRETRVSTYIKIKEKQAFDWPICEVAIGAEKMDGKLGAVRVVLGAAAPIPWRATKAEKILEGQAVTPALAEEAGKAAVEDAKPMSQNAYKIPIFEAVVKRAVLEL